MKQASSSVSSAARASASPISQPTMTSEQASPVLVPHAAPLAATALISASATAPAATWSRVHAPGSPVGRSEEHTSELQSLMRISYAVFCLTKKKLQVDQ